MRDFLCNFIWSCENNVLYLRIKFIIMKNRERITVERLLDFGFSEFDVDVYQLVIFERLFPNFQKLALCASCQRGIIISIETKVQERPNIDMEQVSTDLQHILFVDQLEKLFSILSGT